jgi:drug/metabolite transporter (DMT)-like permease
MTRFSLGLILVAALIHASWNVLAKRASGGAPFVWLYGVVAASLYAPVAVWLLARDAHTLTLTSWGLVLASAALHLLYALALQRGYQVADLTVVYPVARGTGPLLSTVGAIILLGEPAAPLALLGAASVIAGVFLIAGGPRMLERRDPGVGRGIRYGVLTGTFIASYTVLDGYAVKTAGIAPLLDYLGNVLRSVLLGPAVLANRSAVREQWRANWKLVVGVGALAPLSYVLVLWAVQTTPVSHVAPAREVSMLIAALFGAKLLREKDAAARILGAVLIALGVAALALG